jgi:hypothetical protein
MMQTEPSPRNACNDGLLDVGDGDRGLMKGESSVAGGGEDFGGDSELEKRRL